MYKTQVLRRGGSLETSIVEWEVSKFYENEVYPLNGFIIFEENQVSALINISVLADNIPEFEKTIPVNLKKVMHIFV